MTKAELIKALEPYSDDCEVVLEVWNNEECNYLGSLDEVRLSKSCDAEAEVSVMLSGSSGEE